MVRQTLPIYARTRTAAGPARSGPRTAAVLKPLVIQPTAVIPARIAVPALPSPYRVSTLAGKVDTVWHASSHGPRKPLPVPVWRSGFRDGSGARALFNKPTGLAVDRRGHVFVADSLNHCIRRISPGGRVVTLAGNGARGHVDGPGRRARFNHPTGLALSPRHELYIIDQGNGVLRRLAPDGQVSSFSPGGKLLGGIAIDSEGLVYLLLELRFEKRPLAALGRFDPATGETRLLADWEGRLQWLPYRPGDEEQPFSRWWQCRSHRPRIVEAADAGLGEGLGLAFDARNNSLCWLAGYHLYRLEQGPVLQLQRTALKLDGVWPLAHWQGLSVDAEGVIHVLDARHHSLYRIRPGSDPERVLDAGLEGLLRPYSVATDGYGQLYISDTGHWRVCRLEPPGRDLFVRLARMAFLPYFPAPPEPDVAAVPRAAPFAAAPQAADPADTDLPRTKGIWELVNKSLRRKTPPQESLLPAPVVAEQHVLDVLAHGKRSQQLACVKELVDQLRLPQARGLAPLQPIFEVLLAHRDTSVRTLLIRHICDLVHHEQDALFWISLLDHHREPNRLLKKYLIEVLVFLGKRYELYGHVVPLLVEYIRAAEEDVVEYVFQHLLTIRRSGYESLVDPLIEELGGA